MERYTTTFSTFANFGDSKKSNTNPPADIMLLIALLAWVKPDEVQEYMNNKDIEMMRCLDNDVEKETWKLHSLYRSKIKSDLEEMCKRMHLPIPAGYTTKNNLVKLIANKTKDSIPKTAILYSGNLACVPATTTGLGKLVSHFALSWICFFRNQR